MNIAPFSCKCVYLRVDSLTLYGVGVPINLSNLHTIVGHSVPWTAKRQAATLGRRATFLDPNSLIYVWVRCLLWIHLLPAPVNPQ